MKKTYEIVKMNDKRGYVVLNRTGSKPKAIVRRHKFLAEHPTWDIAISEVTKNEFGDYVDNWIR